MSEEVRKAKSAVPRAMFWSIFMNGVLGYAMVIAILVAMGTVEDALNSTSPIVAILMQATGSTGATTAMITGLFIISFAINLAMIASVSRLTWAWVSFYRSYLVLVGADQTTRLETAVYQDNLHM